MKQLEKTLRPLFDVVFLRPVVGSALMRWLRSASLLRSILRLVFSYVAGASTSGSCAPPPTKKAKQAAEAAAVYAHLSTHAQHVPPLRVGRPPKELTAGSHSWVRKSVPMSRRALRSAVCTRMRGVICSALFALHCRKKTLAVCARACGCDLQCTALQC